MLFNLLIKIEYVTLFEKYNHFKMLLRVIETFRWGGGSSKFKGQHAK